MIYKFESIDSTNNYLKNNYRELNNFDVCVSSFQNNGRGRNNHTWTSNKGENLLFSLLVKDNNIFKRIENITLLIGVSIFKFLQKLNIDGLSIKWPNDIYVNDKKICGILCESISLGNSIEAIVIGIGLNVNQINFNDLNATSIKNEIHENCSIEFCLKTLLKQIVHDLKINTKNYLEIINKNNYLFNKKCYVFLNNKKVEAKVLDINIDNSINCIIDGTKQKIRVNEIDLIK